MADDVFNAIVKARQIDAAANKAEKAQEACQWFRDYGRSFFGPDACVVELTLKQASRCVGSGVAQDYMERAIIAMLPEIVMKAGADAQADINRLLCLISPSPVQGEGL